MSPLRNLTALRAGLRRWREEEVEAALARLNRRHEVEARLREGLPLLRQSLKQWDSQRVEDELRALHFRESEPGKVRFRPALLAVAVALAMAAAAVLWLASSRHAASGDSNLAAGRSLPAAKAAARLPAGSSAPAAARDIALHDGSAVRLADSNSRVQISEQSATRIVVQLESGKAEFQVEHRAERRFIVVVGAVEIEDLGTDFEVERSPSDVLVRVTEGKVRISWQARSAELVAGQQASYPLAPPALDAPAAAAAAAPANSVSPAATWRQAAADGRHREAFQLLERDNFATVRDDPGDLLLAADAARFSGHPARAVAPLRDLLRRHRGHPQSPAAAFTLGSILLRNLNRPGEAAVAFEDSLRLAPGGNLAEDAAARAAEAWFRTGDQKRARTAFDRYVARYPGGRHLAFLERLLQSRPP